MKISKKHKWNEHKKKILKRKARKKKNRKLKKERIKKKLLNKERIIIEKKIIPPTIFSISKNPEKVINFLKRIQTHCQDCKKKVLLDMRNIEEVDVDALMYLKYIAYEIKEKEKKDILMYFISPKNKKLKDFINLSGFVTYSNKKTKFLEHLKRKTSYFEGQNKNTNKMNNNFKIKRGNTLDTQTNKNIVDFAFHKKNFYLYNMMSELMENTVMHAYIDEKFINHKDWYIFAEKDTNKISFVFLDTGLGISKTIQKRVAEYFKIWESDSKLLLSTLEGDKRTRTKKANRGKGLPFIYELFKNGSIQNLRIISNKACFNLNNNEDIKEELKGTFFYWEMDRKENRNENI